MTDLRLEYPRPNLVRDDWLCLNGEWDFEIDNAASGEAREFFDRDSLDAKITVPYCPESSLSGVGNRDYMRCVWYKKDFSVPETWRGRRVILHIGAVDWHAKLWVNGVYAASHRGGYVPFDADITDLLGEGANRVTVAAYDDVRDPAQPAGKQSKKFSSSGCHYTRTTGIWQSVWLEPVDAAHIVNFRVYPDISSPSVSVQVKLSPAAIGQKVKIETSFDVRETGSAEAEAASTSVTLSVPL
ncbi:MAG: beta-galactosidase, partial [Clostridia bacterium]|nr:beta-galactosidase [Clostridia bacterium]